MALLCDAAMGYGRAAPSGESTHAPGVHSMLKGGQLVGSRHCTHVHPVMPACPDRVSSNCPLLRCCLPDYFSATHDR